MAQTVEITCKCGCGQKKMVRVSDVKRGWGKFFSKSCKAKHQSKHGNGYISKYQISENEYDYWQEYLDGLNPHSSEALGQD